jgi:hypothetical protein
VEKQTTNEKQSLHVASLSRHTTIGNCFGEDEVEKVTL